MLKSEGITWSLGARESMVSQRVCPINQILDTGLSTLAVFDPSLLCRAPTGDSSDESFVATYGSSWLLLETVVGPTLPSTSMRPSMRLSLSAVTASSEEFVV